MQGRLRVLLIVALVIIVGAVVAVLLLGGNGGGNNDGGDTTQQTNGGQPAQSGVENPPTNTPAPSPTPLDLVDIVVAVQAISRGSVIPPDAVRLQAYPRDIVPFNALSNTEDVIGQRARTDIFIEQPILADFVVPDLYNLADTGSDLAALLPLGLRAVTLPIDEFTSVAYGIQPGDRVDVIVSLLYVDIDEEFQSILPNSVNIFSLTASEEGGISFSVGEPLTGRFETRRVIIPVVLPDFTITQRPADLPVVVQPAEEARPRLVTQNTIQDALVAWVGEFPASGSLFAEPPTPTVPVAEDDTRTQQEQAQNQPVPTEPPPRPSLVTLAVTPQEAVILTYLVEARLPITFALRPAADTTGQPTDPVTLDYIMNQYSITVPPKRGFSVQPAIRSIRQLITDTQISGN